MQTGMNSELAIFERSVCDFAAGELAEACRENDRYPFAPMFGGVLEKAKQAGYFSLTMSEELDGSGGGTSELCVMLDALSRTDASMAGVIFTDTLAKEIACRSLGFLSLKELFEREEGLGGSLLAFQSNANPDGCAGLKAARGPDGEWELSGKADYVVLGGVARNAVLPVKTAAGGYSFFVLGLGGQGVRASEPVMSLGLRACPAVDLELDGAPARLAGDEGAGPLYFENVVGRMSAAAAAMAIGLMKGSFEEATAYAREREQGGREIINWSEVRRMLARMAIKLKVADMALSDACRSCEQNEPGWEIAARAAALSASEAAVEVTTDGIQVLGGNGYMEDYGQEKRFRDASQVRSLLGMAPIRELGVMADVLAGARLY